MARWRAKAVDGQENPYSVILSNKFYEVQKYVSATNHVYAANIVLVSKKFWDKLSPDRAAHDAGSRQRGARTTSAPSAATPRRRPWPNCRPRACR
jgi:hypothetical protein